PMIPLMVFTSNWYDIFPWAFTLNLAVPVAVVLTGGVILWPDKLAVKLICCANTGIDIRDMDNIQRETIGMYLSKRSSSNRFIFRDI
ncbi:MAG: hypothetical protein WBQ16_06615, partial [Nitrososphaeraceae archaeon]